MLSLTDGKGSHKKQLATAIQWYARRVEEEKY